MKPAAGTSNRKNEIQIHTYRTYITTFWCGTTTLLALLVYILFLGWGVRLKVAKSRFQCCKGEGGKRGEGEGGRKKSEEGKGTRYQNKLLRTP